MRTRPRSLPTLVIAASLLVAALAIVSIATTGKSRTSPAVTVEQAARAPRAVRSVRATQPSARRSAPAAEPQARRLAEQGASLAKMVGQQTMVRMDGTTADPALLARIRGGEVGGVILYSDNVASPAQTSALVAQLQSAAKAGGNPPLLISTDQEGGQVKRLPWAPPAVAPPNMGTDGAAVSESQGRQTGAALSAVGINVDLAPVVDVAHSSASFIWQQDRSFGMNATTVIESAIPFAHGMELAGVAPTAKHFPGLGGATTDTDYALQSIVSQPEDVVPYRSLIAQNVPLIMVSTGVYPNLDPSGPAAMSRAIITGLLRGTLGYRGVVMTDDLERPTGYTTADAVVRADGAGADIVLVSTTEGAGATEYQSLLAAASSGAISTAHVRDAYGRILALKQRYAASASN